MINDTVIRNDFEVKFPLLNASGLTDEIFSLGLYKTFEDGATVMDFGGYIKSIPLIMEGSIKILREDEKGNELFLYYLHPGETCAISLNCCMAMQRSEIKAIADETLQVILIPVSVIDEWISKYPAWKMFMMHTYKMRFDELLSTIDNIAFHKMDDRLTHYLQEYGKIHQTSVVKATHQQIAYELNTSREVISRLLKQMEKKELVKLGRNKIILNSSYNKNPVI